EGRRKKKGIVGSRRSEDRRKKKGIVGSRRSEDRRKKKGIVGSRRSEDRRKKILIYYLFFLSRRWGFSHCNLYRRWLFWKKIQMAFKFESLIVWQKALDLSSIVSEITREFPKEEMYVLSSQIK